MFTKLSLVIILYELKKKEFRILYRQSNEEIS